MEIHLQNYTNYDNEVKKQTKQNLSSSSDIPFFLRSGIKKSHNNKSILQNDFILYCYTTPEYKGILGF